ncbi:MAG: YcaO-like family protein [Candidatus Omnitrophica bacterium]|nr:YcaO-like family protein [Candidatus Omnitrophota bacterium]
MFYHPRRCFTIDAPVDTAIGKILHESYSKRRIVPQFLDLTTDLGVPTYRAFVKINGSVVSGSGTHLNAKIAVTRAICELNVKLAVYEKDYGLGNLSSELASNRVLKLEDLPNYSTASVKRDLELTERLLLANGFNPNTSFDKRNVEKTKENFLECAI